MSYTVYSVVRELLGQHKLKFWLLLYVLYFLTVGGGGGGGGHFFEAVFQFTGTAILYWVYCTVHNVQETPNSTMVRYEICLLLTHCMYDLHFQAVRHHRTGNSHDCLIMGIVHDNWGYTSSRGGGRGKLGWKGGRGCKHLKKKENQFDIAYF